METVQSQRTAITALILSLILHCCIFFIFTLEQNEILNADRNELLSSKQEETDTSWAATKARASQFGAPVIFHDQEDEAEDPQENTHNIIDEDQPIIQKHEQAHEEQPQQEVHNNNKEEKTEPSALTQEIQPDDQQLDTNTEEKLKKDMAKKASSLALVQKKVQEQKKLQPPTINTKKQLTLAQLTKGFLDQIHQEGNHSITMHGKEGGLPTDEQLKHERYLQKLSWCLQNSFKINRNRLPSKEPTQTTVEVFLALNKDGTLHQLQLVKSCGDFRLDQFTLFIFRDASSSFPPVPRYLPNNPFKIVFMIEISTINDNSMGVYRY